MKFFFLFVLMTLSLFAEVEYIGPAAWSKSDVQVLLIRHDGDKSEFITPAKIKEKVKGFNYNYELSKDLLELQRRQIINRLKVARELGSPKGEEYLQKVMGLRAVANVKFCIIQMEKKVKELDHQLKNLLFYRGKYLLANESELVLYYYEN